MAESQGAASHFWNSLKHSMSLRKSQDADSGPKKSSINDSSQPEILSGSDVDSLPPLQLQNGSAAQEVAEQADQPEREARRSSSWIRRLSVRKHSTEACGLQEQAASSGRLPSGDLQANGHRQDSLSTSSGGVGRSSKQNGLHSSSVVSSGEAEGSGNRVTVSKASPGSREAFLEDYDAATLALCNRLAGTSVTCIGDTAFQEVAPWNKEPGYLGFLNSHQKQALEDMKHAFPESKRWHTDHDLLRFLRAREFDQKKAKAMYKKYLEEYRGKAMVSPNPPIRPTRGPFDVDLVSLYPEREAALTARLQKLMEWFLHTIAFGTDKYGRPVIFFRPGDILNQKMTKHVPVGDRISFQSTSNEMLTILTKMASQNAGYHIDSIIQVLDLGGMSAMQMVSHMRSPDAQQEWQHNLDFHPELLHKIYIINAPSGMPLIWKVASPFLPAATKRKVEVLGNDYKKVLEKAIGSENIPSCYGGKISFEWQPHRKIKELEY